MKLTFYEHQQSPLSRRPHSNTFHLPRLGQTPLRHRHIHACLKRALLEARMGGDKETQKKSVMNKQGSTLCFVWKKLTQGRFRIPAQAPREHISSRSPPTHVFNLCSHNHSLQPRWASCPTKSSGLEFLAPGHWSLHCRI
jgi:hypothetical protein